MAHINAAWTIDCSFCGSLYVEVNSVMKIILVLCTVTSQLRPYDMCSTIICQYLAVIWNVHQTMTTLIIYLLWSFILLVTNGDERPVFVVVSWQWQRQTQSHSAGTIESHCSSHLTVRTVTFLLWSPGIDSHLFAVVIPVGHPAAMTIICMVWSPGNVDPARCGWSAWNSDRRTCRQIMCHLRSRCSIHLSELQRDTEARCSILSTVVFGYNCSQVDPTVH